MRTWSNAKRASFISKILKFPCSMKYLTIRSKVRLPERAYPAFSRRASVSGMLSSRAIAKATAVCFLGLYEGLLLIFEKSFLSILALLVYEP